MNVAYSKSRITAGVAIAVVVAATLYLVTPREHDGAVSPTGEAPAEIVRMDGATAPSTSQVESSLVDAVPFDSGRRPDELSAREEPRGPTLTIAVTDGRNGAPVEEFGVRCILDPRAAGQRSGSGSDSRLRARGRHPGGVVVLERVVPGSNFVVIDAPEAAGLAGAMRRVEISSSGAQREDFALEPLVEATIRVRREDGSPVPESAVQVLRNWGGVVVDHRTPVTRLELNPSLPSPTRPLLIASGQTDGGGSCRLPVPAREPFVVRAPGPGHGPVVRGDVVFTPEDAVLEIVVTSGATVAGRIGPEAFLASICLADLGPTEAARRAMTLAKRPSVELGKFGKAGSATLDEDGRFRIECVPPGDWPLSLRVPDIFVSARGTSAPSMTIPLTTVVDLVDGETRNLSFDLSAQLRAEVRGEAWVDGRPLANAGVTVVGTALMPHGPVPQEITGSSTDEDGRFVARLLPGEYRLMLRAARPEPYTGRYIDGEVFRVAAGQKLERRFEIRTCVLAIECVLSDGTTPAAGISIECHYPVPSRPWHLKPTDAEGKTSVSTLEEGTTVTLKVWHRSLTKGNFRASGNGDGLPADEYPVPVTTLTLAAPETRLRIVLPASAGY